MLEERLSAGSLLHGIEDCCLQPETNRTVPAPGRPYGVSCHVQCVLLGSARRTMIPSTVKPMPSDHR